MSFLVNSLNSNRRATPMLMPKNIQVFNIYTDINFHGTPCKSMFGDTNNNRCNERSFIFAIQSKFQLKIKIINFWGPYVVHFKHRDSPYVVHFKRRD